MCELPGVGIEQASPVTSLTAIISFTGSPTPRHAFPAGPGHCPRHGIADGPLANIPDPVGMRTPSLYSFCGCKYERYDAIFTLGAEQFEQRDAIFDPRPGDAAFKARVRAFLSLCTQNPARCQIDKENRVLQRPICGCTIGHEHLRLRLPPGTRPIQCFIRRNTGASGHWLVSRLHVELWRMLGNDGKCER